MKIHIFNPEHDLALAFGGKYFTAPAAGRDMRASLAYLPLWWADEEDVVLVDDEASARTASLPFEKFLPDVKLIEKRHLADWMTGCQTSEWVVDPWGWNAALCGELSRAGCPSDLLPDKRMIAAVRDLSHRQSSITLLKEVTDGLDMTVGERFVAHSLEETRDLVGKNPRSVLKMPWSSSGRGIRYVRGILTDNEEGYVANVLKNQGSILVEPYYDRVMDFAMEFWADGKGSASFLGLSLFETVNGAYVGNLLAPEETKRELLAEYLPLPLLDSVTQRLVQKLGAWCNHIYHGPLGVDMMVVRAEGDRRLLHPCVEVNLRRTMGHVALHVAERTGWQFHAMHVTGKKGKFILSLT